MPTSARVRDFSAIDPIVQEFIDANGLNGAGLVIVDREDGIVHEHYWGEFDADRVSFIASSSKMLTAGVLVRLADQGLVDLDAPVADAVDWGAGNPEITPAQLMSNSSGLVGLFPDPAYRPYLCQFLPNGDIEDCGEAIFETPDDDADLTAPDTEFRYGGAQWQVAGALAEAVSGSTWTELIDETYIQPCGVDSLGYNNHFSRSTGFDYPALDPSSLPPTENPNMEGGAFIDPPDYGRLLLMHLRGGECDGGRVLDAASVDLMHADRTLSAYDDGASAPGYGMGWWVDRATGRIRDPGAYGAVPWLDLDRGYGAYLVVEATSDLGGRLSALIEPEIDAAMANA
jgi:CubicO group peptidase (beta-lactamase class C family)